MSLETDGKLRHDLWPDDHRILRSRASYAWDAYDDACYISAFLVLYGGNTVELTTTYLTEPLCAIDCVGWAPGSVVHVVNKTGGALAFGPWRGPLSLTAPVAAGTRSGSTMAALANSTAITFCFTGAEWQAVGRWPSL